MVQGLGFMVQGLGFRVTSTVLAGERVATYQAFLLASLQQESF